MELQKTNKTNKFSKSITKAISKALYEKVLKHILVSINEEDKETNNGFNSYLSRKAKLISLMEEAYRDLEFNPSQIALTVCYADKFISSLTKKGHKFNFIFMKSILILSITAAHKMTCDFPYSTSVIEKYFEISNLGQLEGEYYELVSYEFYISSDEVEGYLKLLLA